MKLIDRTDMTKYTMPMNPWPRWAFLLWALGSGDRIATHDYAEDFAGVSRWRMLFWRVRGAVLPALFGWWRYV